MSSPKTVDAIYEHVMQGEPDFNSFSEKEVRAAKDNLDNAMQNNPALVKSMVRVGIMRSTDVILKALMAETKECVPIMQAVANIIGKTLEYKSGHSDDLDPTFFAELIRDEIDKTWLKMQEAFADHLKANKQEN